ncbi:MAG: polysaccharide biosynthesis tyrosine autokinase [Streptosporangiaceae bacterium]
METAATRSPRSPGTPGHWYRFLVAHLAAIVLITLGVTAGAALLAWSQTREYLSTADVVIYPAPSLASSTAQTPDMGTEQAIASSYAVVAIASRSVHLPVSTLQKGLSVSAPASTYVLAISYKDPNRYLARRVAQSLAQAYVTFRTPHRGAAGSASTSQPIGGVQAALITPASLPNAPSSPDRLLDVGVGLIVGLVLGTGVAFLRDWMDDRLRGPADLEGQAGAPVLAVIPAFRRDHGDAAGQLVVVGYPDSKPADAYRNLRTRVLLAAAGCDARTLLVASPAREERATVAANLAAALALSGRRAILVCADLRSGTLHELFSARNDVGLSSNLLGTAELSDAIQQTDVPGLTLLTAGPAAADLAGQAQALPKLLQQMQHLADYIVIEAPAVLSSADASALAELAEMVLLVADARQSTRAQVRAAAHELEQAPAVLIGCVLDNLGRRQRLPRAQASHPGAGATAATGPRRNTSAANGKAPQVRRSSNPQPAQARRATVSADGESDPREDR